MDISSQLISLQTSNLLVGKLKSYYVYECIVLEQ